LERAQLLALRSNQKCVPYERRQSDWWREVATAKRSAELGAIVFATPWNLPSAMTETVNGRKQLRYDQYAAWATYLSDFDAFMKNNR
jgi:glucuronoarabinoxylan endo-1,4-beta-xylanase